MMTMREIFFPRRNRDDLEFLPAALEIVETPASPVGRAIALAICAFFLVAALWSYFSHVDIISTAPGKIITTGRTKVIQPIEIGTVRAIRVEEGQHVQAGDVLIELDPTNNAADSTRFESTRLRAQLDIARLTGLMPMASTADPFIDLEKAHPQEVVSERSHMQAQRAEHVAKLAGIDQGLSQKRAEKGQVEAGLSKIDSTLPLAAERAKIRRDLLAIEYSSKYNYLQDEQHLVELTNERVVQTHKLEEANAAITALERQKAEITAEFEKTLLADLSKAQQQLAEAEGELTKARQRTGLQTLTAPVDGVVQQLAVHTLGGVVTPAQQLMMVVPSGSALEVEAVISNKDVGFVTPGQLVEIKVETFTFTRYGLLQGVVREVSTDSVPDPHSSAQSAATHGTVSPADDMSQIDRPNQLVYIARISLDQTSMDIDGHQVSLSPGMAVTAEIKTGRRRVFDYLLSPLRQYAHDGLRER